MKLKVVEALNEVQESFKKLKLDGIYSICAYGSAVRDDFIPGWSDIDLLIVFNYDFVVPRECYENVISWYSEKNSEIEKKYNFKIEISPHDKGNLAYGKFCFRSETFNDHLKKSAKILFGNDIRKILSSKFPKGEGNMLAYSLWITRKNIIELNYANKRKLKESVKNCIGGFKNFLRSACYVKAGSLKGDSTSEILEQFYSLFPEINREEVEELMKVPYKWDSIDEENYLKELLFSSLNLREKIIEIIAKEKFFDKLLRVIKLFASRF